MSHRRARPLAAKSTVASVILLAASLACGRPPQQEPRKLPPGSSPKAKEADRERTGPASDRPAPTTADERPDPGPDPVEDPGSSPDEPADD